ncbi:bifunctional phosphopantothenoylcysteine decarboxylase/phosphopantothenate--cysteine ligase CoaBC [Nitrosophilus alvini]|uniref:bifunctional phosphopantothenoylcysteine decarboxylase/phosphopantothenate--cysteine ligase CoaBC n=1 Tax=Nitrosophilus alvini TaxID=2714855 RepID=UPI003B830F4B
MPKILEDKKILVGVTGSISVYKSLELIRLFVKAGAEVKTILSPSAQKFVSALTFETLCGNRVLNEENEDWTNRNNHIHVAEDYDILVIAPATANTINKLSNGIADNLLLQTALAFDKPKIIAPAANTKMIKNPITEASIKMLKLNGYEFVNPVTKELACKIVGEGALAEPIDIFWAAARELLKDEFWEYRRVVVTGGGTIEKIDEVRYISNFSSGKQAAALATALYLKGADVCLITTKEHHNIPPVHIIEVESAKELKKYLEESLKTAKKGVLTKATLLDDSQIKLIQKTPYLFMAAAVSDYRPKFPQQGKLKKETLGEEWDLKLIKNEDILKSIDKTGICTIGFKAETDKESAFENARKMLFEKELDAVCLNILKSSEDFGSDTNEIIFITETKETKIPRGDKLSVSLQITELSKEVEEK